MSKTYKVWIHIEEENPEGEGEEEFQDYDPGFGATREFETLEDAEMFASALHEWGQKECD